MYNMSYQSVNSDKYCIIVDAFSSGSLYAAHFKALGLKCIHIQSRYDIKLVASTFKRHEFIAHYQYNNNIEELVCVLREYNPLFVIPGFHTGVYLAEEIGTRLNIPSNSSKSTKIRMDKYLMHQKLAQCGISHSKSYLVNSEKEILKRYESDFECRPVIVKPSDSAGTDSVFLCRNVDEVIQAFEMVINGLNAMDFINEKVLIQEYLEGQEYIVNTITFQGWHIVTDIWRSDKIAINKNNFIYDKTVILEAVGDLQNELCEYNNKVLDAMDFTFGACHNELIYTSKGPVLIEINPRISGGHLPEITYECTRMGQILWFKEMIGKMIKGVGMSKLIPYNLDKKACSVCLISKYDGLVKGYKNLEKIKSLPSYHNMDIRIGIGEKLVKTVDVWTGPGMVALIHEDPEVIEADYKKIREIEEEGLFTLR